MNRLIPSSTIPAITISQSTVGAASALFKISKSKLPFISLVLLYNLKMLFIIYESVAISNEEHAFITVDNQSNDFI